MSLDLTRRAVVAALASAALALPATAQDWRADYPELNIGVSSSENETDSLARNKYYADYLSAQLGVPVNITRGTDYAAVIEAMRSGHVQIAAVGPAAYALARKIMGEEIVPVAITLDNQGNPGYHSILAVRADSDFQTIEDVKGASFAFADPNSTSGYAVPSYYLATVLGTSADEYFGEVAFSGGHQQSVVALVNGTFDVVATHWQQRGIRQHPDDGEQRPDPRRIDPDHLDLARHSEHPGHDAEQPARRAEGRVHRGADGIPRT